MQDMTYPFSLLSKELVIITNGEDHTFIRYSEYLGKNLSQKIISQKDLIAVLFSKIEAEKSLFKLR